MILKSLVKLFQSRPSFLAHIPIFALIISLSGVIWFFSATDKLKFMASAIITIVNKATVTFQDSLGVSYTLDSNEVATVVTDSSNVLNLTLTLTGRTSFAANNVGFKVYPVGQSTPAFEKTDVTTDIAGHATVTVTGLTVGTNYDYQLKPSYFLSQKKLNTAFANDMVINLTSFKPGDLNNDNMVNSLDYSFLNGKWDTADAVADINQDGLVNTIDFSLLNSNWFQQGQ